MMKTHYRRISKTALGAFRTSLTHDGVKLSEYTALGFVGAVKVGVETGGYIILEVVGEDKEGLPGKLTSKTFEGLKNAARLAVHHARVRVTTEDGEKEEVIPENEIPKDMSPLSLEGEQVEEGDAVLAMGINPHRFL